MNTTVMRIITDYPHLGDISSLEGFSIEQTKSFNNMQRALVSMSPSDLRDQHRVDEVNKGLEAFAQSIGAPAFESLYIVDATVSEEGLISILSAIIRKVFEWIASVVNWFLGLFRKTKVTVVAQNAHAASAATSVKKKAEAVKKGEKPVVKDSPEAKAKATGSNTGNSNGSGSGGTNTSSNPAKKTVADMANKAKPKEQVRSDIKSSIKTSPSQSTGATTRSTINIGDNQISFGIPAAATIIFHSQNHIPENQYIYDADSLRKAMKNIRQNIEWLRGKLSRESGVVEMAFRHFATGVANDANMQELFSLNLGKENPLLEPFNNGWNAIGIGLSRKPLKGEKLRIENVFVDKLTDPRYTWNGKEGVVVEFTYNDLVILAPEIADQVKWANSARVDIISSFSGVGAGRIFEKIQKELSKAVSDNKLTVEKQTLCTGILNELQGILNNQRMTTLSLVSALSEYGSLLNQILSGVDSSFTTV